MQLRPPNASGLDHFMLIECARSEDLRKKLAARLDKKLSRSNNHNIQQIIEGKRPNDAAMSVGLSLNMLDVEAADDSKRMNDVYVQIDQQRAKRPQIYEADVWPVCGTSVLVEVELSSSDDDNRR